MEQRAELACLNESLLPSQCQGAAVTVVQAKKEQVGYF